MAVVHGKNFIWTHLEKPTEDDILEIAKNRDLHPLVAQELLHPTFHPKIEVYDSYIYLILHFPRFNTRDATYGTELDVIIGKDFFSAASNTGFSSCYSFSTVGIAIVSG